MNQTKKILSNLWLIGLNSIQKRKNAISTTNFVICLEFTDISSFLQMIPMFLLKKMLLIGERKKRMRFTLELQCTFFLQVVRFLFIPRLLFQTLMSLRMLGTWKIFPLKSEDYSSGDPDCIMFQ